MTPCPKIEANDFANALELTQRALVYPHNYLRVNTIFEIIKAAGYRTAWSDKHIADEMIQGPSGEGVDDLYLLEINASNSFGVSTTKSDCRDCHFRRCHLLRHAFEVAGV